jgi:hypothetical protein
VHRDMPVEDERHTFRLHPSFVHFLAEPHVFRVRCGSARYSASRATAAAYFWVAAAYRLVSSSRSRQADGAGAGDADIYDFRITADQFSVRIVKRAFCRVL